MTVPSPVASPASAAAVSASAADTQEIPESVTAELEKLEQEGGPMVEVEGVGAILAELGDDKELLGKGDLRP
jgi:histone-lysine N-methyltransferase MLL3